MSPLPSELSRNHRPPVAKRVPANDHQPAWAGRGHLGAFLIQLSSLVVINLVLWGLFAWWAMQYAKDKVPLPAPGSGPL